jgi:hypothetical protein
MNLVNALPLDGGDIAEQGTLISSTAISVEPHYYICCDETLEYIQDRLPEHLCESFEDLIGNNKVRSPLIDELQQKVAEILSEREDDVGD